MFSFSLFVVFTTFQPMMTISTNDISISIIEYTMIYDGMIMLGVLPGIMYISARSPDRLLAVISTIVPRRAIILWKFIIWITNIIATS